MVSPIWFCLALILSNGGVFSLNLDILMPNVSPKTKDAYLCYSIKIDQEKPVYITEFNPKSTKDIAHHMLLFGCDEPGSTEQVWNCGEMNLKGSNDKNTKPQYQSGPVCKGFKQSIVYAWAMDAPKLTLPDDVAFKIGTNTNAKYLVLQVHYANVDKFQKGEVDASGIQMKAQLEPTSKVAGTYLLSTDGAIKARTNEYFEVACEMDEDKVIYPFAYRTHAHKLGLVNSGYRVRNNAHSGKQEWTEIGRRSPQLPQMFYQVSNFAPIKMGDVIAARCTMKNYLDHNVYIGSTGDDEMCNFYFMYYVEGDQILDNNMCMSRGPPRWYFENFKGKNGLSLDIRAIPLDASEVPQTDETPNMIHAEHETEHGKGNHHKYINQNDMYRRLNNENDELEQLETEYLYKLLNDYLKDSD